MHCGDGTGPVGNNRTRNNQAMRKGGRFGAGNGVCGNPRTEKGRNRGRGADGNRGPGTGFYRWGWEGGIFDDSTQNEKEVLQREAALMETALEDIKKRLAQLEETAEENKKSAKKKKMNE
ncbi:MAG: DUF5320 domain-containing protein [bacterium]|nr:DUF5320 domain-containing protein [bacterium]